jgi:hypothetical protein
MTNSYPYRKQEEKNSVKPGPTDLVDGHKITTRDISDVREAGISVKAQRLSAGNVGDSVIKAQKEVTLGRSQRDEQNEIALNWDGQRRMRGYDLAEHDLSGFNLANSDLRIANLRGADGRIFPHINNRSPCSCEL